MTQTSALVIIPTYNEVHNVEAICEAIWKSIPDIHILVVDDASTDGTREIARRMATQCQGRFHLLERRGKLGLGTAYIAGFKWALNQGYKKIVQMDADFSHDPVVLEALLKNLDTYGLVIGSRYCPGGGTQNWSWLRQLISRAGSWYARSILALTIYDLTGGFNAWNGDVLERIDLDAVKSEGYAFQIEMKYRAAKLGVPIFEHPIIFHERRAGHSKMSSRIILEAIFRVWAIRQ